MLEHDATSLLLLSPPVTPLTRKRADASDPTAANAKSRLSSNTDDYVSSPHKQSMTLHIGLIW